MGGNDLLKWWVEKIYYSNNIYDMVEEFMIVYDVGFKMIFFVFEDKGLFFICEWCGEF